MIPIMAKKTEVQGPPGLPRQGEREQVPTANPAHEESPNQASAKSSKQELREKARRRREREQKQRKEERDVRKTDWLADPGSMREKQFLLRWVKQPGLGKKSEQQIWKQISNPDKPLDRNLAFWKAAKEAVLGPVVYETAMARHKDLDDREWLVAYFTAQGVTQEKIAELTYMSPRMVDEIIRRLKDRIARELRYDIESVAQVQIALWFFGL